jgi:glycosyltransferase involved in cell wall biosynthesis
MTKVLLFAADIVPVIDLPASGGGIRGLQLKTILEKAGHEVVISCPIHTYLGRKFASKLPQSLTALSFSEETQESIFQRVKPDAVVFASNWTSANSDWWPSCPTILDLCGPVLLEGAHISDGDAGLMRNLFIRKSQIIANADFYLCGGQRQQWYFRQAMIMAGLDLMQAAPVEVLPLGVHPDWIVERDYPKTLRFVYAGGLYPWQNPSSALNTIAEVLEERQSGELIWIGGSHNVNPQDTQRFIQLKKQLKKSKRVSFQGYLTLNNLNQSLRQMSVSVELMECNLERELALTTRTPHYMGLGLPILYGDYAELAAPIAKHQAGWTIDPKNNEKLRTLIHELIDDPNQVQTRGQNAQKLAKDEYSWAHQGRALVNFVANPSLRDPKAKSRFDAEHTSLTRGERWALKLMRKPFLKPIRALMQPFFAKKQQMDDETLQNED